MNLNTLSQGEPWMTPEERALNQEFVHATTERLTALGVPESPLTTLRVNDVVATWLLARRLEYALAPEPGEPAPCPTAAQAGAIGKCRDRLRRAMKDLEACLPDPTDSAGLGLAEKMHPVAQCATEPAPDDEHTGHYEIHETERANPEPPHNPAPEEDGPSEPIHSDKPGARGETSSPMPPHTTPAEPSMSVNRAARRHLAREEKRLKKLGMAARSRPT